jgi:N-acetylmuramic acid 6-phosphate etherase
VALVHAIEGFEDYPDYGIRHLDQLGFNPDDMLISCTEGGETPYVIGATTRAAQISKNPSYFLYCNPTETLTRNIERSRRIIATQGVESIEVFVGPMALAGSTRMQASTVLQLAVGLVLFSSSDIDLVANFKLFLKQHESLDYQALIPFIEREASTYLSGDRVLYSVEDFAITVFTDTTERAPTFNLPSFESSNSASGPSSYSYVCIPSTNTALASWEFLLSHGPRALNWEEVNSKTTDRYLHQFDFSQACAEARAQRIQPAKQRHFEVLHKNNQLYFSFDGVVQSWQLSERGPFYDHLLLKMLLNSHSTLMMGRLGRYVNNIMTWVKPTNNKLIDRAARYVLYLLAENQQTGVTYEQVIYELFQQMESMNCAESLVNRTCQALSHPLPR